MPDNHTGHKLGDSKYDEFYNTQDEFTLGH